MSTASQLLRVLVMGLVLVACSTKAQGQDRALTSGLAVGLGAGNESAFLGGHALYYFQLPDERWRIAPHVGVGFLPGIEGAGYAGGLMTLFGRRHRLVLDLLAAPFAAAGSTGRDGKRWYGLGLVAGYEWMARYGFAIRSTLGVAYRPELSDEPINLAINVISMDYKFW